MGALNQVSAASLKVKASYGARRTDQSYATVPQPYFPIKFKNRTPLLVAVQKDSEGLPTPADQSESVPTILRRDDFVLLNDDIKHWIVRIEDISLLEARQNFTLVHIPDGKLLIRRSLGACERRLDSSSSSAPAEAVSPTSAT